MSENALSSGSHLSRNSRREGGGGKTRREQSGSKEHATATLRSGEHAASQPHHGILICKYSSHGSDGSVGGVGGGGSGGGPVAAVRGALAG